MTVVSVRIALLSLILPLLGVQAANAGKIDLDTPQGALVAMRKIQCSAKDAMPVTYYWHGEAFSRVAGEPDRKLFNVYGMNIRQCGTVDDPARGKGFRLVSRELLVYADPQTGEILKSWKNPWTGKVVEVIQTANDPVNQPPIFSVGRGGAPVKWTGTVVGNQWWQTMTIPLFYTNPLAGDYQDYVGGKYHATEMFNFFGNLDDLVNDRKDTAETRVGWVRLSGFLPWMEMGDREGLLYFHTAGRKLDGFEQLPDFLRKEIAQNYPEWSSPPPLDDARPNETSWSYFRKKVAAPAHR
jgi:hypothetical protein